MNNENYFCPLKQTRICQIHQPVFLPHPLLCRNISSVLFAIVASSGLKSLVTVCLPLTLLCEIWKWIKVEKNQMFLTVFFFGQNVKTSLDISDGKCSLQRQFHLKGQIFLVMPFSRLSVFYFCSLFSLIFLSMVNNSSFLLEENLLILR